MKTTNTVMSVSAVSAGVLLALAAPMSASAHVSASATSTAAGSYTVVTFAVPHGCDASATTKITIDIPESILSVTPTVNANWTISETKEPLESAVEDVTERDAQVIYTALTPLPDGQRDTFELSLKLPDGEAGDVVEFPVTQDCVEGQTLWVGDEVPSVTLTAAVEGDGHGHGAAESDGHADEHSDDSAHSADGSSAPVDVLARVLGIAGLVVGAIGIVIAVLTRRTATK